MTSPTRYRLQLDSEAVEFHNHKIAWIREEEGEKTVTLYVGDDTEFTEDAHLLTQWSSEFWYQTTLGDQITLPEFQG